MMCLGLAAEALAQHRILRGDPDLQVLRWHLRIMMQPAAINGAVAKPNSSAPSSAPTATSRPGAQAAVDLHGDAPAQLVRQRLVGFGKPDLQGEPACLIEVSGEAPGAALEAAMVT